MTEPLPRCASSAADLLRFAFCRHCGGSWQLDDTAGLATHEATCATRTLRQRAEAEAARKLNKETSK